MEAAKTIVGGIVQLVAVALGGYRVVEADMTVGSLVGVLGVAAYLASSLGVLVALLEAYTRLPAAADRIATYLEESGAGRDGQRAWIRPTIHADAALSLVLADGRQITCEAGRFTAFVAPGASVADILVEDAPTADIDPTLLPDILRISPHETHLFEGAIRDNVTGPGPGERTAGDGHGEVSDEVLQASGANELVDLFADGLDHPVTGSGGNLSGGQHQRIALARALRGPPLPRVLTDPTTAVDSVTEAAIAAGITALRESSPQGTLVVRTTSPNLLAVADEVVFVDGDWVYRASHAQLVSDDESPRV